MVEGEVLLRRSTVRMLAAAEVEERAREAVEQRRPASPRPASEAAGTPHHPGWPVARRAPGRTHHLLAASPDRGGRDVRAELRQAEGRVSRSGSSGRSAARGDEG